MQLHILAFFFTSPACDCSLNGTESCNKENGQCICKSTIEGIKCDACKDGSYGYFPNCSFCPIDWITGPSIIEKCYLPSSTSMTYHEAKATCESLISKLAEPLDLTETEFIYGAAGAQNWIGVNDIQEENEYGNLFPIL